MNQNWFTAVRLNNNNAIQRLVNQGVDINARDEDGETALYRAVKVGEKAVAKLLEHGADPNIRSDFSQETPLTEAVSENNPRIVELLLNKNADTNALNGNEYTPLIIAAENMGNRDKQSDALRIIELLCQAGADTNQQDGAGNHIYPLERLIYSYNRTRSAAIKRGIVDAIIFLNIYNVNLDLELRDEEDDENYNIPVLYSPLLSAIKDGRLPLAILLIELGADVNYDNGFGETPLFLAARSGYVNLVEELLNRGASITDEIREIIEQNSNNISSEEVRNLLSERIRGDNEPVEPVVPRNISNNVNVGTCYDFIELDDIDAKNFLRQDRNNIIFAEGKTISCQDRRRMGSTGFLYECREATGFVRLDNIIRGEKFIKIGLYKNLISEADYNKLLDKHYAIYILKELEPARSVPSVVDSKLVEQPGLSTWVGADHCQPNSGGKLYTLEAYTVEDGIQQLKRNGGKKHAKKLWHTRKQRRGHLKKRSATRGRGRKYRTYSKKKGGKGKRNKTNKRK